MASKSIGSLYAELTLRDGKFRKGMKNAVKQVGEFGVQALKFGSVAGGAIAAGLTAGTVRTLDQIDALGDLSNQTGVAVGDMMILQRAYKDGGREAEMAGKDIGKMQKALVEAASGGNDPFTAIGLSAKELMNLNPAQQFAQIGDAIMRIQNPAERTAKAMEIFGKGGMGLTTVFPGLKGAEQSLGRMPALAQQFAGAMGEANDLIGHLPVKSDQFFTGFTAGIIGELLPNLQKIDNYDFTNIGQSLGTSLASAFEQITNPRMWEIWSLNGTIAITKLIRSGEQWMDKLGTALGTAVIRLGGSEQANQQRDQELAAMWKKNPQTGQMEFQQGASALDPFISELETSVAVLSKYNDQIERRKDAQAAAESVFAEVFAEAQNKGAPLTDVFATEIKAPKPADVMQYVGATNDYQRRGLGTGGENVRDVAVQKQLNILMSIDGLMKRVEVNTRTAEGTF